MNFFFTACGDLFSFSLFFTFSNSRNVESKELHSVKRKLLFQKHENFAFKKISKSIFPRLTSLSFLRSSSLFQSRALKNFLLAFRLSMDLTWSSIIQLARVNNKLILIKVLLNYWRASKTNLIHLVVVGKVLLLSTAKNGKKVEIEKKTRSLNSWFVVTGRKAKIWVTQLRKIENFLSFPDVITWT